VVIVDSVGGCGPVQLSARRSARFVPAHHHRLLSRHRRRAAAMLPALRTSAIEESGR